MSSNPKLVKISSVLGVTAVVFILDWFFLTYITSHGFELKRQELMLGSFSLSVPLQWLPVLGIVIVSLVVWYEVSVRIFPRRGGMDFDPLSTMRLVRAIVFSVTPFILFLYLPYLIGSNWFWARMSETSKGITQVRDFGLSLLRYDEAVMALNPLWQYSVSQVLAPAAMVLAAVAFARGARRVRKPR